MNATPNAAAQRLRSSFGIIFFTRVFVALLVNFSKLSQ